MLFNLSRKVHLMEWFSYTPLDQRCLEYIFGRLLLCLLLTTAAIVLEQFHMIELLASVWFCSSQSLFSFLALKVLMK